MTEYFQQGDTLVGAGGAGKDLNILVPAAGGLLGAIIVGTTVTPANIAIGAGLSIVATTLGANWQLGPATSLGSGVSLAGGVLSATGSGGSVTSVATSGAGISGGPITNAGTLSVQWNAGTVSTIGDGAAVSASTLQTDHQATQTVSTATATVTPAGGTSSVVVTLQASTTLTIANGNYAGQHLRLELLQDATGSRTVAFDASVEFGTDIISFTATTAANKRDLVQLIWNSTSAKWMFAAVGHGFS